MKFLRTIIPCLLLGACMFGQSKSAKFYTQSPMATTAISADYASAVGINKVQLPKYMDRPQIVTQQKDSTQVKISEFNRWVESPAVLATRALTDNLSTLLPAARIKLNRSSGDQFDRIVSVEVVHMSAILGEQAELVAWYIIKEPSKKSMIQQKFVSSVQIGKTYDDLAKGYNKLLSDLSQEIAEKLIIK